MKAFLATCLVIVGLALQANAAETPVPLAYASTFGGETREVQPLDAPENPYSSQYSDIDVWVLDHAIPLESLKDIDRSAITLRAVVNREGFLIPYLQSAEYGEYVRRNASLIGDHNAYSDSMYRLVATGQMDAGLKKEYEDAMLAIRAQYYPEIPEWIMELTDDHFFVTIDETKPYPGNPTDWQWWMERRQAEKQSDGSWKVWELDSVVPLSDGSWIVTRIVKGLSPDNEMLIENQDAQPVAGLFRPVVSPFPRLEFGTPPDVYSYRYLDEWRSAAGEILQPQQRNNWSDWRGMFSAYTQMHDERQTRFDGKLGIVFHNEYIKLVRDGKPEIIYNLLAGKVYDADDPALRKPITSPGKYYGHEIDRDMLLKVQALRQSGASVEALPQSVTAGTRHN